ncbi:MAG TPA: ABC transporter permease [Chloroflexota bacterium]
MSESAISLAPFAAVRPRRHPFAGFVSRMRRNRLGMVGLVLVVLVGLVAVFAPWIAPYPPNDTLVRRLSPPSGQFLLGSDDFGRDVLSRLIYGARVSFYVGFVSVGIALTFGSLAGLVAGYFGRHVDNVIMRIADVMFSIPPIVLAIAITAILGPSLTNAMVAIGIVYTPSFARVVRGPVLAIKETQYIEAAHTVGASSLRIIFKHLLPNVTAPLIVQTTFNLSTAILTESTLSFLGLGIQPPDPSWGTMLSVGRVYMELAWWLAIFPGLAIMISVMGFNLLGDGLRDVLDPRLRADR